MQNLVVEQDQHREWQTSVDVLQQNLSDKINALHRALLTPAGETVRHVILEFDFRRRGLRMDCDLLGVFRTS